MVLAGIISGLLCAAAVCAYLQSVAVQADRQRAEALERYGGEQVQAVVATRDILPGETIAAADVASQQWLAALMPKDAVGSTADAVGKQVASPIAAGEVVTSLRFDRGSTRIDVPAGMTAVSLPTEEVKAVGGAIVPGSAIDIYLTGKSGTKLLGSGVLVLATSAQPYGEGSADVSWVTVAVKPDAVEQYVSSAETGNLYFALPGQKEE